MPAFQSLPFGMRWWWLLVGHALSDYVWQDERMAAQKNPWHHGSISLGPWWWTMGAHGLVNGGIVAWITGRPGLGILEMFLHSSMDTVKCMMVAWSRDDIAATRLWTWIDQLFHVLCKGWWAWVS